MKIGNLVRYHPSFHEHQQDVLKFGIGIVTNINFWKDSGAPDRNFGITVTVLWPSGTCQDFEEDELEVVK